MFKKKNEKILVSFRFCECRKLLEMDVAAFKEIVQNGRRCFRGKETSSFSNYSKKTASPAVFDPWFSRGTLGKCRGRDLGSPRGTMGPR